MKQGEQGKSRAGREQDTERATSGGGLGQGRETAAGMPDDQMADKGRPGKGMGGTSDSGTTQRTRDLMSKGSQELRGPAPSGRSSDTRPSKAGRPARDGGDGIPISDHDGQDINGPNAGAEWSRQRGMGRQNMDRDL